MGRLYWKFFLFLFLAQLTTALGVGIFILLSVSKQNPSIDQSPIGQSLVDAAQSTLNLGGVQATKALLKKWEAQHLMHRVFVIDQTQQDLLKRKVDKSWLDAAYLSTVVKTQKNVVNVTLADQQSYLIFVVSFRPNRGGPPHPARLEVDDSPIVKWMLTNPFLKIISTFPLKGLLIGTLASVLFAAILAWYFSKPIKTLRLAFERAAEGHLNVSVADKMGARKDELSDLGRYFDHMAIRLSALLQGQTRLLHHVSHELRSPLARMHMALGLASQNPDKAEASLNRIELEANRMDKLIGELLELSRFESGMVDIKNEHFSLNEVLETVTEDASFEAANKRIRIVLNSPLPIRLMGQQDLMHRAVENVVRNAIKYAPNDSVVNVECHLLANRQQIELSITDQGAGVLETEKEDIFKPFVRGQSGSQVVGHGVGLAITKQVIEAHHGKVVAQNLDPYGFRVTITLPAI